MQRTRKSEWCVCVIASDCRGTMGSVQTEIRDERLRCSRTRGARLWRYVAILGAILRYVALCCDRCK